MQGYPQIKAALLVALIATAACSKDGVRPGPASTPSKDKKMTRAGLSLRLQAGKTTLAAGQPLELRAFLHNGTGGELVVMLRASHVDLGLDARNSAGDYITTLLPPGPPRPPTRGDLQKLAPGASMEFKSWELLNRVNRQIGAGNGRTGEFRVKASYHAGVGTTDKLRTLDPAAWTGSLTSDEIVITVK